MAKPLRLAIIGGTSLLGSAQFSQADPLPVVTPYGPVTLLEQEGVLFLQRHGLERYTPPHRINHHAHIYALQQAGAEAVLAIGSVGSLRLDLPPGTVVVPDDFYAPHLSLSFFDDQRGHLAPGFHPEWRNRLLDLWQQSGLPMPRTHGVYWQTTGPRFETPAEIRILAPHVHVVGMTIASETILAAELSLPYAALCMVDNFANGIEAKPLSYESFKAQVHANEARLLQTIHVLSKAVLL
ncbi:MAG: MTAP family purine nucleoside phosphorylase [Magnetococcales bacterium]|nr:MTAP family purine nucleoside phosphorylase [Magnetococcales bacterium]